MKNKLREAQQARGAQGIAAEILFYRFAVKKIEAESPVFCGFAAKNALLYREKSKCRCSARGLCFKAPAVLYCTV
jgi:hypothetical protein